MSEQEQTQATSDFDAEAFACLLQKKWAEMMQQSGWPRDMAMPGFGPMGFMAPFMPMGSATENALAARITQLENRVMELEIKLAQRNNAKAKKPPAKA